MLTKIRLDGVLGKKFGREWDLSVSSPAEALRLIEANKPGLRNWIINNQDKYNAYRVTCTYADGHEEDLNDTSYDMSRLGLASIRFTPSVEGSGAAGKIIVGAILIAASFVPGLQMLFPIGVALVLGGVIEALSPRPKKTDSQNDTGINSYYFDGPANTETQGSPVPLIYGRVLAGSHTISASISIDEVPT